jgi:hypothetical protein
MYGRWVWTDYGWYWLSDESFGWATYHYGRWQYDDYYGWIWIPDDVWGPAWVEWRYDDDYIGWAPLSPAARFDISFGMTFDAGWVAPIHYWNFVPCRSFTSARIVDYVQPVERTRRFFGNTRGVREIVSNGDRIVNRGVDVGFVERHTRSRIERTDVVTRSRGEGDRMVRSEQGARLEVYRPRIESTVREADRRPAETRDMNRIETMPRRRYEVQRNKPLRREVFQQQSQDTRITEPQRSNQIREPKPMPRKQIQIERNIVSQPHERKMSAGRESRPAATPHVDRTPPSQQDQQQMRDNKVKELERSIQPTPMPRRETRIEPITDGVPTDCLLNSGRKTQTEGPVHFVRTQPQKQDRQQGEARPRGRKP